MSGHSKWATTKHKKAAIDAKRGKLFAKLIKNIEIAAEAGAEDVTDDGEVFTVVTGPSDLFTVRKALQEAGFDYDSADQVMQPKNEVELSLEDARKVSKLIDNLDDLDDVQNIYSNWTASDEVMAQLDEE